MKNIKLIVEYDGTNYFGWQKQTNVNTIQEEIEKALKKLTKEDFKLIIASRTDSGVHARGMVCNFKTTLEIPLEKLPMAINSKLPRDIVITEAIEVEDDFHCRYHAKKKTYSYTIYNRKIPSAIESRYSWHVRAELDFEKMQKAASYFVGHHDFAAFRSLGSSVKTTTRTIYYAQLTKTRDTITLEIQGNGFLYNMVRIIMGTLVDVGKGRIKVEDIPMIIESRDRKKAGMTAPAAGLVLEKIYY